MQKTQPRGNFMELILNAEILSLSIKINCQLTKLIFRLFNQHYDVFRALKTFSRRGTLSYFKYLGERLCEKIYLQTKKKIYNEKNLRCHFFR